MTRRQADEQLINLSVDVIFWEVRVFGKDAEQLAIKRRRAVSIHTGVRIDDATRVAFQMAIEEFVRGAANIRAITMPAHTDHRVNPIARAEIGATLAISL